MAVSRLEDARRTIDEVIVDLTEKRDMNDEALREVRSVNSEIIEDFRRGHTYASKENLLGASTAYAPDTRSVNVSSFDLRAPAQDDALSLRGRLNEELRRNNDLMARVSRLEEENRMLKRDYQMSFGPGAENGQLRAENEQLRRRLAEVSQLPQQIFQEIEELKRENQHLRGDTVRLLKKMERL